MSAATHADRSTAPSPPTSSPDATRAPSGGSMPALAPPHGVLAGPPRDAGARRRIAGVQRRGGNRAVGALLGGGERAPTRIEALWHEASRTGSRAAATRVAQAAVAGARPGGLPHAGHIRAASKGAVDPAKISATVVDDLPALGVCYDGKIALRRGAPASITAHEVAHSMGADEATAHRVERDPSLLGGLPSAAPVNGWAIGFEFQCTKADNPKVYEKDGKKWEPAEKVGTVTRGEGFTYKHDGHDLEMVTDPFPETDAGRESLWQMLNRLEAAMAALRTPAPANSREAELQEKGPIRFRKWDRVTIVKDKLGQDEYAIVARNNDFTAHPQATVGMKVRAISELLDTMSYKEARERDTLGWSPGSVRNNVQAQDGELTAASFTRVDEVVAAVIAAHNAAYPKNELDQSRVRGLKGLLKILAGYVSRGRRMRKDTLYLKNLAPFMLRNSIVELFDMLTPMERGLLSRMRRHSVDAQGDFDQSIAKALEYASAAEYLGATLAPGGVVGIEDSALSVSAIVGGLLDRKDAIRDTKDSGIHQLKAHQLSGGARSTTDIGEERKGVFIELRRLASNVPYTKWKDAALAVYDVTRRINKKH